MTCNCSPLFLYQDFISHIPVKPASSVKCFQKTHQDRYGTHQPVAKVALIKESKWKLSVSLTHCTDAPAPTSETRGRASTSCSPDIQIRSRWQGKKMNRILNWLYFIIWYWLETTRKLFAMSIVPFPEVKHNIWNEAIKSLKKIYIYKKGEKKKKNKRGGRGSVRCWLGTPAMLRWAKEMSVQTSSHLGGWRGDRRAVTPELFEAGSQAVPWQMCFEEFWGAEIRITKKPFTEAQLHRLSTKGRRENVSIRSLFVEGLPCFCNTLHFDRWAVANRSEGCCVAP